MAALLVGLGIVASTSEDLLGLDSGMPLTDAMEAVQTMDEADVVASSLSSGDREETGVALSVDNRMSSSRGFSMPVGVVDLLMRVEVDSVVVAVDIALTLMVSAWPFSTTVAQIFATCGLTHCLLASLSHLPIRCSKIPGTCDAPCNRGWTYGLALVHSRNVLSVMDRIYTLALTLYWSIGAEACRTYGPNVASYQCSISHHKAVEFLIVDLHQHIMQGCDVYKVVS